MRIPHGLRAALAGQAAPPAPSSDANFENVSLLLHGDGTNGAQNNTFTDGSTNNFTITRNGNTTQGTFSPFSPTGWSGFFDGSGDSLSIADNDAFEIGSGDFTIECWIYLTAYSPSYAGSYYSAICAKEGTGSGISYRFFIEGTASSYTKLAVQVYSTDSNFVATSANYTFALNTWYHVACVRSGTSLRLYVNGTDVGGGTNGTTAQNTTSPFRIGTIGFPSYEYFFPGYISNLRIVKGTALYTSNFTPPTSPLTAITNTSLLTLQDNRFKDNSTNNFTITRNGDTKIEAFSPFNPTAAYSASTHGGSGYFDGTGDYLSSTGSGYALGSGDYTVELWVYHNDLNNNSFLCTGTSAGSDTWQIGQNSGTVYFYPTATTFITGSGINLYAWHHIAATRSGSTVRLFIDGVLKSSTTDSTNLTNTNLRVGFNRGGSVYFNGYMSNARIVKGTALYTSAFTPPTAPLTAVTNTSLLLNFTNGGIIDNATKNVLETVGNAQISTSVKKFGTGSMYFDGTGDYAIGPANTNLNFGTGDFTVELWANIISSNSFGTLFNTEVYSQQSQANTFALYTTSTLQVVAGTYGVSLVTSSAISANTWTHIAVTRQGTSFRLFIDGVLIGTATNSTNFIAGGFTIGALPRAVSVTQINGYIDDLRITKGVARYTANFTPPTQAFPDL